MPWRSGATSTASSRYPRGSRTRRTSVPSGTSSDAGGGRKPRSGACAGRPSFASGRPSSMPQRKQNPDEKASSSILKLTKMIERKTKDAEVGDLIHYSFHDQGSVWIVAHNIAALSEIAVRVEVEDGVF